MDSLKTTGCVLLAVVLLAACSDPEAPASGAALDEEAIAANNRAVGLMGRFEYEEAHAVFAGIVERRPDWDEATRLAHEKASLGIYVTGHPLNGFKDGFEQLP